MRSLFILTLISITGLLTVSCNKDTEARPEENIIGSWNGKSAKVIVYKENGKDILSENTISLEDPNFAQAKFNEDQTFSVVLRLKTPMLVNETRAGTYEIIGNKIKLTFTNVDDDPQEAPFTLQGDNLTFMLGEGGNSTLTYTLVREKP